jgi:hypothetical protein
MKMKKTFLKVMLTILISLLFLQLYSGGPDRETLKIMPFVESASYCIKCHPDNKSAGLIKEPALSCNTYCMSCHSKKKDIRDKHHVVRVRINFKPKFEFRSSANNRIMCITCHNLKRKRYDSVSWKSESLFERMFKGKKQYRTFYLVIRNNEGKLCTKCHY